MLPGLRRAETVRLSPVLARATPLLSVTVTFKAADPDVMGLQVKVAVFPFTHPGGRPLQLYVYGAAPPENVADRVTDWPTSKVVTELERVGAFRREEMVRVSGTELTLNPFESWMETVTL